MSGVFALINRFDMSPFKAWKYHSQSCERDERIDFLKGLVIIVVVINHIVTPSLYHIFTIEAIGAISAAECFVFLSGYVIGFIYHKKIEVKGLRVSVLKIFKRAFQIYLAALGANIIVYLFHFLPLVNLNILTSYTDIRTGIVYPLYGNGSSVPDAIEGIILLKYGASQINILGLYVVLVAITPLFLILMKYRHTLLLIVGSWIIYGLGLFKHAGILPMQSESAFPILLWQLLFVHGMAIGYHKYKIKKIFVGSRGKLIVIIGFFIFISLSFFALNNPWYNIPLHMRFNLIPEHIYFWIYSRFFERTILGIGRFFNTILVVSIFFVLLNYFWVPINRMLGWLFIPMGKATLYVFIVHLLFVGFIYNVNYIYGNHLVFNTLAQTIVIFLIWFMVSKRVLFKVIPR